MNNELQNYARQKLKDGLAKLPETHQMVFKRMYHHQDLNMNINDVVDNMPEDKLEYAMLQVQNSLDEQK